MQRFAADAGLGSRTDSAMLVVSELVTNAVLHGRPPIELGMSRAGDDVRIEVFDADPHADAIAPVWEPVPERSGGRGLRIVNALAHQWGVEPTPEGKMVWAVVGLDESD